MKVRRINKKLRDSSLKDNKHEELTPELEIEYINLRLDSHETFPDEEELEVGTVTLDVKSKESLLRRKYKLIMPPEWLEVQTDDICSEMDCGQEDNEVYIRITRGDSITVDCSRSIAAMEVSRGTRILEFGRLDLCEVSTRKFHDYNQEDQIW